MELTLACVQPIIYLWAASVFFIALRSITAMAQGTVMEAVHATAAMFGTITLLIAIWTAHRYYLQYQVMDQTHVLVQRVGIGLELGAR